MARETVAGLKRDLGLALARSQLLEAQLRAVSTAIFELLRDHVKDVAVDAAIDAVQEHKDYDH